MEKMKSYEEVRDEAAKNEPCDNFTHHCCIDGFKKGSDFGKAFSDKWHEKDLLIKSEANDVLRSINKALSQRIQDQDAEIAELKQEISGRNAINKMCVNEMDELENKIIAQDAIIKTMEEALKIYAGSKPEIASWQRSQQFNTFDKYGGLCTETSAEFYANKALTALNEFRNNNEQQIEGEIK